MKVLNAVTFTLIALSAAGAPAFADTLIIKSQNGDVLKKVVNIPSGTKICEDLFPKVIPNTKCLFSDSESGMQGDTYVAVVYAGNLPATHSSTQASVQVNAGVVVSNDSPSSAEPYTGGLLLDLVITPAGNFQLPSGANTCAEVIKKFQRGCKYLGGGPGETYVAQPNKYGWLHKTGFTK